MQRGRNDSHGMIEAKALVYEGFGKPRDVLRLERRVIGEPAAGEVLLKVLAAPLHPSDIGMILGKYGRLQALPAVAGREGVAEVLALGTGVTDLAAGDRVVVPRDAGSWQSHLLAPADGLFRLPADLQLEMAAMVTINPPTAWRLLRDANLAHGDWVVQNAANSAVGLHVIEMARHLGLKTLNVVRREELIEPLLAIGADVVVTEESGYEQRVKELTDGAPVKLALNSVGGLSAMRLIQALSADGQHVTFGAMSFEDVRFPTRQLIFDGLVMRGFWMDRWYRSHPEVRQRIMFEKIFDLMRTGVVRARIAARFGLEQFAEALEAAAAPRLGKVLFVMEPS